MGYHSGGLVLGLGVLFLCTAALLVSPVPSLARQARHADVTDVVVIEVPVQVTQGGKPVRGLTPEQFELFDGRKRRELTGFDAYDLSGASSESMSMGPRIPVAAQRKFLLLFDLSQSTPNAISRAQEAAKELVATGLEQTDLVGLATWSTLEGLQLVLGFSPDRRQAGLAIDTLGLVAPMSSQRDPLGVEIDPLEEPWKQTRDIGTPQEDPGASDTDFDPERTTYSGTIATRRQSLAAVAAQGSLTRQDDVKRSVEGLFRALTELAQGMRSVEGRKSFVIFSEGFDSSVLVGQGSGTTFEQQGEIQEQNQAATFGVYELVDSNQRFGDTSLQNELTRVVRELVRADCVIQAVDIGGLRAGSGAQIGERNKQGLFMLANGTGGELFENYNDLSGAMAAMLERTSVTYVLAFHAENLKLDGKFHKLQVLLEGRPDGYRVVHRPGYFSPRPYAEASQLERKLSAASRLFGAPGGELGVATLAAPFETTSLPAYIPSLVEIKGADLLKGTEGGQVTAEVYAYAISTQGEIRDYYSQIVGIDLDKAGPALQQRGLKLWSRFEVPPGEYVARVLVRNAATGTSGVAVAPFRVPDAGEQATALLPPLFPEPAGQWLNIRGQRAEESEHEYPFTVQGQAFEPAVKPVLVTGQSAAVLLAGYGLGDSVRITGELFTPDGKPVGRVFLNVGEQRPGDQPGLAQWAATLSASGVESGDYVLKVTATEPDTGETHFSSITVSVSG